MFDGVFFNRQLLSTAVMGDPCQLNKRERERGKKVLLSFGTPSSAKMMRGGSATDNWIYEVSVP